jgi:hypothetical protein
MKPSGSAWANGIHLRNARHPKRRFVASPGGTRRLQPLSRMRGDRLFPIPPAWSIMKRMQRTGLQFSLLSMLGLVACVAVNIWLFRCHVLAGIVGLNVTKHVVIAYLCQVIGVDKRRRDPGSPPAVRPTPRISVQ